MDARWVYVGSELLGAAASLAFAPFRARFVPAMILRFLGGIGIAGVHMPGLNLLMDRVDRSVQGRAAGIYTSSYAAGNAGSFLITGFVDAAFGWRATFIVAGIGPLLSICALGMLPAPWERRTFAKRPPPFRPLLRNRALIDYVAAFAGNTGLDPKRDIRWVPTSNPSVRPIDLFAKGKIDALCRRRARSNRGAEPNFGRVCRPRSRCRPAVAARPPPQGCGNRRVRQARSRR